jgi:hypothetical protein
MLRPKLNTAAVGTEEATQAPSTGHTRASTKAGVGALFTSDVVFAKGAHLRADDGPTPRPANAATLLCCETRSRAIAVEFAPPPFAAEQRIVQTLRFCLSF